MAKASDETDKIFNVLKRLLAVYSPPLTPRKNKSANYALWSDKAVEIDGRKRKEVFFAAATIQKGYVGFYYMPVYSDREAKDFFRPELLALRKGLSCFHLRTADPKIFRQIEAVLKKGFTMYKKRGWI